MTTPEHPIIYFFSGTGNSRYAARLLAGETGAEVISVNDRLREGSRETAPGRDIIFVSPTYAWRIPRVLEQWIRRSAFPEGCRVWFVMTCGSEIGDAARYNRRLAAEKQFSYMGTAGVVMPENYIAMFDAPGEAEARDIIARAEPVLWELGRQIGAGRALPAPRRSLYDRFMSGPVNPLFYRFFVKAGPFYAGEGCTGCGACAALCPLHNIRLQEGRPVWGKDCTHCMACICRCPAEAIEYGKKSAGKPRYHVN